MITDTSNKPADCPYCYFKIHSNNIMGKKRTMRAMASLYRVTPQAKQLYLCFLLLLSLLVKLHAMLHRVHTFFTCFPWGVRVCWNRQHGTKVSPRELGFHYSTTLWKISTPFKKNKTAWLFELRFIHRLSACFPLRSSVAACEANSTSFLSPSALQQFRVKRPR